MGRYVEDITQWVFNIAHSADNLHVRQQFCDNVYHKKVNKVIKMSSEYLP